MLMDIFSGFDDHNQVFMDFSLLVWGVVLLVVASFYHLYSVSHSSHSSFLFSFSSLVMDLGYRGASKQVTGTSSFFSGLIVVLFLVNIWGLVPYVFSLTSHLAFNMSVSLPLWGAIVLMSLSYDLPSFLAHLQPQGSPAVLSPFLCLIEGVSLAVRPVTLAVRLTANLSTGHILMALLGTGFVNASPIFMGLTVLVGAFYFTFEMAVCGIQAYIFTLLPTLYMDEHPKTQ